MKCRSTWVVTYATLVAFVACDGRGAGPATVDGMPDVAPTAIRIGYQKTGSLFVLRGRGTLEKRLAPLGASVEWIDFPSGPALYEAMRGGSVDLGYVGETPPVFAIAGGVPFIYAAFEPPSPRAEAILVPKGSSVRTVGDLRGRRVALNRGSNVHFFLVRALREAGLDIQDVRTVFLPPADGRTAFEAGHVDAWVVWDPFYAAAEMSGARVIRDGSGLVNNRAYYVARKRFATEHPELLAAILMDLETAAAWAKQHPMVTAALYSESTGLPLGVMERAEVRHDYGAEVMTNEVIAEQQGIAGLFRELGLIPRAADMGSALPDPPIRWSQEMDR